MASLCSLPIEARQSVLCQLPDIDALQATILAHSALYSAFADRRAFIIRHVLLNLIGPELLPDAVLALNSAVDHLEPWSRASALRILEEHEGRRIPATFEWSISNAYSLQKLHRCITFFTSDFLSAALSAHPRLPQRPPPSPTERRRVARSFYRYEIHRHLFGFVNRFAGNLGEDLSFGEQWDRYYRDLGVWEFEQFSCVYDHVFRRVAAVYNETSAHCLEWTSHGIPCALTEAWESPGPSTMDTFLNYGLEFCRRVLTAETAQERYQLLSPHLDEYRYFAPPVYLWDLLGDDMENPPLLKNYPEHEETPLYQSVVSEPDRGPSRAWKWAHMDLDASEFAGSLHTRELRRWGYVMWDSWRLDEMSLFESPFVFPPPLDADELRHRREVLAESIAAGLRRLGWNSTAGGVT